MRFSKLISTPTILATAILVASTANVSANDDDDDDDRRSIPSVVVTVENSAPSSGAFQTPFWLGIHNGLFDIYDRDVALGDLDTNENLVPAPLLNVWQKMVAPGLSAMSSLHCNQDLHKPHCLAHLAL